MKKLLFTVLTLIFISTQAQAQISVSAEINVNVLEALQELSTETTLATLAMVDGEFQVVITNLKGEALDILSIDTLNFPDQFYTGFTAKSKNTKNIEVLSVDGNGEVISANPYISDVEEK